MILQFEKFAAKRVRPCGYSLPENQSQYVFTQTVRAPPISRHEFEMRLSSCQPGCKLRWLHDCFLSDESNNVIRHTPKKRNIFLYDTHARDEAWGLHAVHHISFLYILSYHLLIIAGPFVFWGWWLGKKPADWQNASVPFAMLLGSLSLFWSGFGLLDRLRESR